MNTFLNFINGEFVATGKTFDNRNPATGRVIGTVHEAGAGRGRRRGESRTRCTDGRLGPHQRGQAGGDDLRRG